MSFLFDLDMTSFDNWDAIDLLPEIKQMENDELDTPKETWDECELLELELMMRPA